MALSNAGITLTFMFLRTVVTKSISFFDRFSGDFGATHSLLLAASKTHEGQRDQVNSLEKH